MSVTANFANFLNGSDVFSDAGGYDGTLTRDEATRLDFEGYLSDIFSISFSVAPSPLTYGASSGGTAGDPFQYLGFYDAGGNLLGTISGFSRTADQIKTSIGSAATGDPSFFLESLMDGDPTITGGPGGDEIGVGTGGTASVLGGDGADNIFVSQSKNIVFDGGAGSDKLAFAASTSGLVIDLSAGTGTNPFGGTLSLENVENISGTQLADHLRGNDSANTFIGLGGYDTLIGEGGDDRVTFYLGVPGASDSFHADGGTGIDNFNVVRSVASGALFDVLDLLDPTQNTGVFKNAVISGFESFSFDGKPMKFLGSNAGESIASADGDDWLIGRGGNDSMEAGRGNDTLEGGKGNDTLSSNNYNAGMDLYDGGKGSDLLTLFRADKVTNLVLDITDPTKMQTMSDGSRIIRIEQLNISCGTGADSIVGGALGDTLQGGAGKDTLKGAGGNDTIIGAADKDALYGGAGDDTINSSGGDKIIDGGSGIDQLYMSWSADLALVLDLSNAAKKQTLADGTVIVGMDSYYGNASAKADKIIGGAVHDNITARDGNDRIEGRNGDDLVYGDAGKDTVIGGAGKDSLYGGDGKDKLDGGAGDDSLGGGTGNDKVDGGDGTDILTLDYTDQKVVVTLAASGNGTLTIAGLGTDTYTSIEGISAGSNNDTLRGNSKANIFNGFEGNDKLYGKAGKDTLNGGAGDNTLSGGSGNDTFRFTSDALDGNVARITDFSHGHDRLGSSRYFSGEAMPEPGALASKLFKDLGLTGAKLDASDRIVYNSDTGDLAFDADGNGSAAAIVFAHLDNKALLTASDIFIL